MKTAKELTDIANQNQISNEEKQKIVNILLEKCENAAKKGKYQQDFEALFIMPHGFPHLEKAIIRFYTFGLPEIDYSNFQYYLKSLGFYINIEATSQNYYTNPMTGSAQREIKLTIKWGG